MSLKLNIGIIGRGFVGSAIENFLLENSEHPVFSYDLKDTKKTGISADEAYKRIAKESDLIYLCVPTPMNAEGKCDTSNIVYTLKFLNFLCKQQNRTPVVAIKSTMVPGTADELCNAFKHLVIVVNPEFLTERTAKEDFKNADKHLIGINNPRTNPLTLSLEKYHNQLWPNAKCIFTSPIEAELIKYTTNSFFATKVTFANHMYQLCQKLEVDYSQFIKAALAADPRLGELHWNVPGPDGKLGFGGSCFPKDLNGMINLFKKHGVDADLLETVNSYNEKVRPEKDWETLKGRAVTW